MNTSPLWGFTRTPPWNALTHKNPMTDISPIPIRHRLRRFVARPETLLPIDDPKSFRLWIIYGRNRGEFAVGDTYPHLDHLWAECRSTVPSSPAPIRPRDCALLTTQAAQRIPFDALFRKTTPELHGQSTLKVLLPQRLRFRARHKTTEFCNKKSSSRSVAIRPD